jgi:hypothetical protein
MNVLEQLKAMGFDEKPLQFYDGGDGGGGDPSGGGDSGGGGGGGGGDSGGGSGGGGDPGSGPSSDPGPGPGGSDLSSEISSDFGGTGPSLGITEGQGALTGPTSTYDPNNQLNALQEAINLGLGVANTPTGQAQVAQAVENALAGTLTPSDIAALNAAGLGSATGFNINNPTQSLEEMQAAQKTGWFIENIIVPALISAAPGAGAFMAATKGIAGLIEGKISPGQSLVSTALSLMAPKLSISPGTLAAIINGNMGQAAANTAMGMFNQTISRMTNLPPAAVGFGMNVTGLGREANQAIAGTINQGLGITPSNNLAAIGSAIDQAFGFTPGQGFNFNFDSTGQPSFNLGTAGGGSGGGGGDSTPALAPPPVPAPVPPPAPAPAPAAQSGVNTAAALASLASLRFQEEDTPEEYKVAQIPVKSPFGTLPYGMDTSMPYGLRG